MKILFLCLYPEDTAPSQRFRFEQFFPYFREKGIEFDIDCFYSENTYRMLLGKGNGLFKAIRILAAYIKRIFRLVKFRDYNYIFIQRGASPVGPPVFEYILSKLFKKKIIYDFDDAIWMPQDGKGNKFIIWLKCYGKVRQVCRMAHKVVVGNEFLAQYARKYASDVIVVPTVVDTRKKYKMAKVHTNVNKVIVGWTGSHSTIIYLLGLKELMLRESGVRFRIIADKMPKELKDTRVEFVQWNERSEIEDLFEIDVGLMPLIDNDWTRGKCGFKAIQYMALGIPALVSPVGVNTEIVDDQINGFVCNTLDEWQDRIRLIKNDHDTRARMGAAAREKIEKHYSVNAVFPIILQLLK